MCQRNSRKWVGEGRGREEDVNAGELPERSDTSHSTAHAANSIFKHWRLAAEAGALAALAAQDSSLHPLWIGRYLDSEGDLKL